MLLDTHALIWWLLGSAELPDSARTRIAETSDEVWVSAASAWEIMTKHRIGRLPEAENVAHDLAAHVARAGFETLDISFRHAELAGALPGAHRDPFDRMLIAQAMVEHLPIVTRDPVFQSYDVEVVW